MHIPTILYGYNVQEFRLHSRHSIRLRTDDLNNYGQRTTGKSIIPGDSNNKHYYYGYNIPRQLIYILSWQRLSERNQGFFFGHFRGWRCGRCCNTCSSSFWRVDRDPFQNRGILPFSSQRPPLDLSDKEGLPQVMDIPIFSLL